MSINVDKAIEVLEKESSCAVRGVIIKAFKALKDEPDVPKAQPWKVASFGPGFTSVILPPFPEEISNIKVGLSISDLMTADECKRRYEVDPTEIVGAKLSLEKFERMVLLRRDEFEEHCGVGSRLSNLIRNITCGLCHHFGLTKCKKDGRKCLLKNGKHCSPVWRATCKTVNESNYPAFISACQATASRLKEVIKELEKREEDSLFQVGDIVEHKDFRGNAARIVFIDGAGGENNANCALEFKEPIIDGHQCPLGDHRKNLVRSGYGWWAEEKNLKLIYRRPPKFLWLGDLNHLSGLCER